MRGQLANSAATPAVATITGTAPPGPAVTAVASARCIGGKVVLTTRVTNDSDAAANITVTSEWGSKTHNAVAAGATVSTSTTLRASSVAAGSVQVTAAGPSGSPARWTPRSRP